MNDNDRRLIEDYLPIEAISAEATREKSVRKGHISTLHLWWARRPLVACRAAVYGALVPAPASKNGRGPKSDFVKRLCKYPGDPKVIAEAQRHILEAHAERLSNELGKPVTAKDIEEGRAPRPKVLDMFAGGGAIPLEALRLGCDAYALELNPVAHIIELCTLVYPQKYGRPDKTAKGSAPDGTWAGLAKEVEYWGKWVLERLKAEIGDLYPPIPDPENPPHKLARSNQTEFDARGFDKRQPELSTRGGYLTPVAYLWTRTVRCKNPACGATVPLVRQTWLCKKPNRYVALRMDLPPGKKQVRFEVAEADSEEALGFDPAAFSKGGNATCPFCGTVADSDYVKQMGMSGPYGEQPMAVVCVRPCRPGKVYLAAGSGLCSSVTIDQRVNGLIGESHLSPPDEPLEANPRSFDVQRYGFIKWQQAFTKRQLLMFLAVAAQLHHAWAAIRGACQDDDRARALYTATALSYSRLVSQHNAFAFVHSGRETIEGPWGDGKFPMSWDFAEANLLSGVTASYSSALHWTVSAYAAIADQGRPAIVDRGDASRMTYADATFDAIVTDPPYYDSVSYSNLADGFYVWLKRSLGEHHPEHFSSVLTPKRKEAIAAAYRHGGDRKKASAAYELLMTEALKEAHRVLKAGGMIAVVYAHKTTLGWSTLVDAMRRSGFMIVEAWPIDTEMKGGRKKVDRAMLASSVFLVARKRDHTQTGFYEEQVRPELEKTVRERVETLWEQGVSGADLVIAAVGAGLRAFTRFARVEYANGEEVPAARFLAEVEGVVLETLLEKIFGVAGARVSLIDGPSQFYVLWRYTYHAAELDAGEAIVFTYGLPVELDGPRGLSTSSRALVEKKKNKYRLRDFTERGLDDKLGLPTQDGSPAPLIDVLHRVLYLMENQPGALPEFLSEARPDLERLRLVANTLAGPQLKGGGNGGPRVLTTAAEQAALNKLVGNWRTVMESGITPEERSGVKRRLPGM